MAEILATVAPNTTHKPVFIAVVDGQIFGQVVHGDIEYLGQNLSGSFHLIFSYSDVAQANDVGTISKGSPLDRLFTPQLKVPADRHILLLYGGYVENPDTAKIENLTLLMSGIIDRPLLDVSDDTCVLTGRDESAILQESWTYAQFRNRTIGGVVKEIAESVGLKAEVVDTGSPIGTVYDDENIDFTALPAHGLNDWEFLTKLADYEAFAVFVINGTLFYQPIENEVDTIIFRLGHNIEHLKMEGNFTSSFSRIGVEIASTELRTKDSVIAAAGQPRVRGQGKGDSIVYRYVAPNLSQETAGYIADSMVLTLAQFEYIVIIETIGDKVQDIRNNLRLENTASVFDRSYRIIKINWTFGVDVGWQSEITAVALPPGADLHIHRKRTPRGLTQK